jgi:hypothetical protein
MADLVVGERQGGAMRTRRRVEKPLLAIFLSAVVASAPAPAGDESPPTLELYGRQGDRQERALAWSFVGLSAVDAWQTAQRPPGVGEANPLLGEDPGPAKVLAFKSALTWGTLALTRRVPSGPRRKTALWILNAVQLAVIVHNEEVTAGIIF